MKRGGGKASKGAVGVGFSPDAPRLLRCLPGRVGSRRDPTKQKTMHCMGVCFVCILAFTYSPEPSQPMREARESGAPAVRDEARRRNGKQRSGRSGLQPRRTATIALPTRESRSTVRNRRAASLSLASLVAYWAFASLHPALRTARLRLSRSNNRSPMDCFTVGKRRRVLVRRKAQSEA